MPQEKEMRSNSLGFSNQPRQSGATTPHVSAQAPIVLLISSLLGRLSLVGLLPTTFLELMC